MYCPAPKHELFSSKLDLTALAGQVQISMFQMKSPHLIDAYRKIKKKKGGGGFNGGGTGGERTTNGRMRHISWLGASHLISRHLLNRIFQGLCVPRRERLKSRCTWSPICCSSPAVADSRHLGARWKGPVLTIAAWALLLANSSTGSKGPSTHTAGEILNKLAAFLDTVGRSQEQESLSSCTFLYSNFPSITNEACQGQEFQRKI